MTTKHDVSSNNLVPDANKSSQDNFGMQFGGYSTSDAIIVNQESASLQFGGGSTSDANKANQDNANMQRPCKIFCVNVFLEVTGHTVTKYYTKLI